MARTGRNEPCPCSSGKKFKHCCASKKSAWSSRIILLIIAGTVLLAVLAAVSYSRQNAGSGRVWSAEHGHYHDASGREGPR